MSNSFSLILFLFLQFPFHLFSCSCFSFTSSLWKINRQYLMCSYVSSSPSFTASSLCVLSSSLCTLLPSDCKTQIKHYFCPCILCCLLSLRTLSAIPLPTSFHFCTFFVLFSGDAGGMGWRRRGVSTSLPVIRIPFLCCFTHSFYSSLGVLSLWCFYLPLLKGCPFPDEDLV